MLGDGPAARHPDARHRPLGRARPSPCPSVVGALVFAAVADRPARCILVDARDRRRGRRCQRLRLRRRAACRTRSSSRSRRSASPAASRSGCPAGSRSAACPPIVQTHRRRLDRLVPGTRRSSSLGIAALVASSCRPRGVGPLDLRGRRQPGGRPPHGHPGQRRCSISVYVLSGLVAGVAGDHHGRAAQRRLADLRRPGRARFDRRGRHRRRELPRRPGHGRQRAGRRADDRRDPQRDEPAQRRRVPAADRHRRRHRARGRGRRAARPPRGAVPRRCQAAAAHDRARRPPVLAVRGATKRFGAVLALDDVDLEVAPRRGARAARRQRRRQVDAHQVHQRRAPPRRGHDRDRRRAGRASTSPAAARALGIETVYQDLALFDNLDPAANFYAGRELAGPRWLPPGLRVLERAGDGRRDDRACSTDCRSALPDTAPQVGLMSGGQRQADRGRPGGGVRLQAS